MLQKWLRSSPISRNCPLCKSDQFSLIVNMNASTIAKNSYSLRVIKQLQLSPDEKFPIVRCNHCHFVYSGRLLPIKKLDCIYEQIIDENNDKKYETSWYMITAYLGIWHSMFQSLDESDLNKWQNVKVLDYGAGYGTFLQIAQAPRIKVYGFETSFRRNQYMKTQNIQVISSNEDLKSHSPYHFIICNQVLEHVPNPLEIIQTLKSLLHPKGRMYISVPDYCDDILEENIRLYNEGKKYPLTLNPWEHLNYFSPKVFKSLLERHGLRISIWPLIFPSITSNGIICGYMSEDHQNIEWTSGIITHK